MSEKKYLREAGIQSAIIVDDGYDEAPTVSELLDEDAWESFFDDTYGESEDRIKAIYSDFDPDDRDNLKHDQNFINAIWDERGNISDLLGGLFESYEQKVNEIRHFLKNVESVFIELELSFKKCGRDFVDEAVEADLIVIDLFLGIQQGESERQLTVKRLREALELRGDRPLPSIILMSQVQSIDELAKDFRKEVKLHASAFRHIRKNDLPKPGRMKGLILTLASQRSDSQALANFVNIWEDNAKRAVSEATATLRKIDIDDLQHIKNMLLRFEGLNTSSYILDVFERVLQYEIESHIEVLEAAKELDDVAEDPVPLLISNDRDTYSLLEQTLFVNPRRLLHSTGAEWPISFGDILGPRPGIDVKSRGFFAGREDQVFIVMSPECDLIRKDGLRTALLMAGSIKEINASKLNLALNQNSTPIIALEDGSRYQVTWNFSELRTVTLDQVKRKLHPISGDISRLARLRESSSLNLRQQLLSNLGRIGEIAPLPRSLKFSACLEVPVKDGGTRALEMPDEVKITGNMIIPRHGKFATMILDSNCEDDVTEALLGLDLNDLAPKSKRRFELLKEQTRIRQMFRSGLHIHLPIENPRNAGLLKLDQEQPQKDGANPKVDHVATVLQNSKELKDAEEKSAGLILNVHVEGLI